jgi:hypothetical protein
MKKNVLLILAVLLIGLTSCTKEGCIDSLADNYEASADVSDNSCVYTADMVIYWTQQTSDYMYQTLGFYPSFEIRIDGESIGVISLAEYYTGAPSCSDNGVLTHSIGLGNNTSKSIEVSLWYDGQNMGSLNYTVEGGICNQLNID